MIPTRKHDTASKRVYGLFNFAGGDCSLSHNKSLENLSVVALDDRLKMFPPLGPATSWSTRSHFHHSAFKQIVKTAKQYSDCTVYVNTDDVDGWNDMREAPKRLVWQGVSSIPFFNASDLTSLNHTFLLDMTYYLSPSGYTTSELIGQVRGLCVRQHHAMSHLKSPQKASHTLFHLTVDLGEEEAVQVLESCRVQLENLGELTKPEGSEHTVEVKVGGKHPVAPVGYRVTE